MLFFIELGTRRVHLAGVTANPNEMWASQPARQLVWELEDRETSFCFLIHDNDRKFSKAFDTLFETEGLQVIHTPYLAPNANAFAERWVRSVREECLDHILILNENYLRRVLKGYAKYYNHARPHQGIGQRFPVSLTRPERSTKGPVCRRDVLGGVIHDYHRQPSSPDSGNG